MQEEVDSSQGLTDRVSANPHYWGGRCGPTFTDKSTGDSAAPPHLQRLPTFLPSFLPPSFHTPDEETCTLPGRLLFPLGPTPDPSSFPWPCSSVPPCPLLQEVHELRPSSSFPPLLDCLSLPSVSRGRKRRMSLALVTCSIRLGVQFSHWVT